VGGHLEPAPPLFGQQPGPQSTEGLEVLVQEVIAAMTTLPSPIFIGLPCRFQSQAPSDGPAGTLARAHGLAAGLVVELEMRLTFGIAVVRTAQDVGEGLLEIGQGDAVLGPRRAGHAGRHRGKVQFQTCRCIRVRIHPCRKAGGSPGCSLHQFRPPGPAVGEVRR
jgi:hypothetical protein